MEHRRRRGESSEREGSAEPGESTSEMGHRGESGEHGALRPDPKPARGEDEGEGEGASAAAEGVGVGAGEREGETEKASS